MPEFTISAAARAVGTSRAASNGDQVWPLIRHHNDRGERVIDLAELLRVFGPLKGNRQGELGDQAAVQHGDQRQTCTVGSLVHPLNWCPCTPWWMYSGAA